jgi:hypothetical protein
MPTRDNPLDDADEVQAAHTRDPFPLDRGRT